MMNQKEKEAMTLGFSEWLQKTGHRKTPERFAILTLIMEESGHFTPETLYSKMKNRPYHISRATLYNTIRLLLECGIIIRHQIHSQQNTYERATLAANHGHIINLPGEEIIEFNHPGLQPIIEELCNLHSIQYSRHALYIWGYPKKDV
ncbi:MAG: transcriptional repressor [Bacteroidales bacterium]|nr:transcriptional repressor [Bacteroidales bacterium]